MATCNISKTCMPHISTRLATNPALTACATDDLACICAAGADMGVDMYFTHCVLLECTDTDARKGFMSHLLQGCDASSKTLVNVPNEWVPFLPASLTRKSLAPSVSTQDETSTTSTSTSKSTSAPASTSASKSATKGSTTSSQVSLKFQTVTPLPSTVNLDTGGSSLSKNWADIQIPICGITQTCRRDQQNPNTPCKLDDLKCICKIDNSLDVNKYFDPACLLNDCNAELAKRDWLDAFAYACKQVDHPLLNVSGSWRPFLPDWYLHPTTSTTPSPPPSSLSLSSGNGNTASTASHTPSAQAKVPAGTLAGSIIGGVLFVSLIALSVIYWRTRKKSLRKTAENAVLADQVSKEGFQARINQLMHGNSSPNLATRSVISAPFQVYRYDQPDSPPPPPIPAHYLTAKPAAVVKRDKSTVSRAITQVTATPYDASRVESQWPLDKDLAHSEYEHEYDDDRTSAYVPMSTYESEYDLEGVSSYPPSVAQRDGMENRF